MLEQGACVLSDAELIAILLRNGTKGKDAISLSRELLHTFAGLRGLFSAGPEELQKVRGLGRAKSAALAAAMEIARRQLREEIVGKNIIRDPESVVHYLTLAMRDQKREVFKALFLNKANRILAERDLFHGTVDSSAVHPREVVKAALDHHATAVIFVHNHPSGRVTPSPEDRHMTQTLKAALETVSVKVLDHLIIGDNQHFSFCEHGLL